MNQQDNGFVWKDGPLQVAARAQRTMSRKPRRERSRRGNIGDRSKPPAHATDAWNRS